MPRPRRNRNKSLPPNLYWDNIRSFYRYRNPGTGKFTYFGKDRHKAVSAAKKLNSMLMPGEDLVARVTSEGKILRHYINERFIPIHLAERDIAESTLIGYKRQLKHINKELGSYPLHSLTIKRISDFLASISGARQSNKYRSLISMILDYAKGEGYIESNPAAGTLKRNVKKQRQRLKFEAFTAIHTLAGKKGLTWLQNAMDIALLTLQRESDILRMKFSEIITEFVDDQETKILPVIQKKTEKYGESAYIKIKIKERFNAIIERCAQKEIPSPFLISRKPEKIYKSASKEHHTQILPKYLCEKFAEARDGTHLFEGMPAREKPTFHEIRSLGIKQYEDAGNDAQQLAGHTTRQMTEYYKKGHEIEWTYAESC